MVIFDKPVEGISEATLVRFLNRGRRTLRLEGRVTVLLASSARLRRLNREFRGKDQPTDVLSFPSELAGYAGDIAISLDIARQNGARLGHGAATEIKILTLHGLLHLAGYDHETDNGRMARRELLLRRALGLPGGLIERANSNGAQPSKSRGRLPRLAASGSGGRRSKNR